MTPLKHTSAYWTSQNILLKQGQQGYEIDTGLMKIGDGVNRWNELMYYDFPTYFSPVSGTDTYIVTYASPFIIGYFKGLRLRVVFNNTNTGASTINLNSIGAVPLTDSYGYALLAGAINPGTVYDLTYDGAGFQIGTTIAGSNSYVMEAYASSSSPLDETTYYFGFAYDRVLTTIATNSRIYIPKSGNVKAVYLNFIQVSGSSETSTVYFRLNNSFDTIISSAIVNNASRTYFNNTALNIAVSGGDFFEIKWITPTWATNPTSISCYASIYIE